MERAVVEKKPVPEIDFTLHTMEDGTQVSTQERVCKGMHRTVERETVPLIVSQTCKPLLCSLQPMTSSGHPAQTEANQISHTSSNISAGKVD